MTLARTRSIAPRCSAPCGATFRVDAVCGICGTVQLGDGPPPDAGVLRAMNAALVHRGPDSDGYYLDDRVGLAMRRLSIIDLEGGDQPIANEDGSVQVIQNGEIYNYRKLADNLRASGHTFRTESDTEVLVHLYEEHGPAFVERLRGMFAFALWDRDRRRLLLARDRYGIKPLYWRRNGTKLSFASELKALLREPDFSREIDLEAVNAFLALNFVPTPLTIFKAASKLPPGHMVISEDGAVEVRCYARPRPVAADGVRGESPEELGAELRDRLRDSVRAHLVADVPVGVLLSGGLDSSVLTALASEEGEGQLRTFTIGFEERSWSEVELARLVSKRFGTEHHELVVKPAAVELLPRVVECFDEPFADNSALPTYLLSEMAAEHTKVVLSGEGGDELFGGYYYYLGDVHAKRLAGLGRIARPAVDLLPSGSSSRRIGDRLKRFARGAHLPPVDRHAAWSQVFSPEARAELLTAARSSDFDHLAPHRTRYSETEGSEELSRMQDIDIGTYLVDDILVKIDRASMAHSLESRVPFLDPVVTDFALALPAAQKVAGRSLKRLFRHAVTPLIPVELRRAPKKGFVSPAAAWFRGELQGFAREVLSTERTRAQGLLDPKAVESVIDVHVSGREDLSRNIWGLVSLSLWYDRYAG
jgi:asparagine synthase (glutamine-hydrolysing)